MVDLRGPAVAATGAVAAGVAALLASVGPDDGLEAFAAINKSAPLANWAYDCGKPAFKNSTVGLNIQCFQVRVGILPSPAVYLVMTDHDKGLQIVSIQGTATFSDAIRDFE